MPQKFVFVTSRGFDKPHSSERKTIRSHCMKDRNRKQPKPPKRAPPPLLPVSDKSEDTSIVKAEEDQTLALVSNGIQVSRSNLQQFAIPNPPPLSLYFTTFPTEVSPRSKALLFKYYEMSSSTLYIDTLNQPLRQSKAAWHEWFAIDVAFMHAVLCVVSGVDDFIRRQPISRITYQHLRMAIKLLNQRLNGAKTMLTDSTVAVVVMLGYLALGMGEVSEARAHLAGLQQIVQLRGGLGNFGINQKLAAKVCHLDICFYLMTGEPPSFCFPNPPKLQSRGTGRFLIDGGVSVSHPFTAGITSPILACLFEELQMLTEYINVASISDLSSSDDTNIHDIFYSIHYRLVYLHGMLEDTNDERMRLAILAFMATTYRIPGGRMPYHYLTKRYRTLCKGTLPSSLTVKLWLLLIGAILVFEADELWLREIWQAEITQISWKDARQRLQELLWIDAIHDEPGRKAFDKLNKQRLQ